MSQVKARILLWGIAGAGKTATLEMIHSKLQPNLRGALRKEPTRLDPTIHFEALPIKLGEIGGVESQIEIVAVPGAPDQAMTRKQLLDEVDGIVLVIDSSPTRIEENWKMLEELRASLRDYGRELGEFPIVLQYNKRDIADPFEIENFHRKTGLTQAAVFETIATTGHGILATLTTISKFVVRARKGESTRPVSDAAEAPSPSPNVTPTAADPGASSTDILEAAILAEVEPLEDEDVANAIELDFSTDGEPPEWDSPIGRPPNAAPSTPDADAVSADDGHGKSLGGQLRIVSAGTASVDSEGGLRLPLVLGDENGETRSVVLALRLDDLPDGGGD